MQLADAQLTGRAASDQELTTSGLFPAKNWGGSFAPSLWSLRLPTNFLTADVRGSQFRHDAKSAHWALPRLHPAPGLTRERRS